MPILAEQESPSLYPDNLLTEPPQSTETEKVQWWVLRTKPRMEKAMARQLRELSVPFYLPLHARNLRSSGRKFTSYCPVFPSYLFVYGTHDDKWACWQTNRLVSIIDVQDTERLSHELRQLKTLLEVGAPVTTESRLEPGIAIRIRNGVFKGLEGTIVAREKKTLLRVSVEFLSATIALDEFQVEPLDYEHLPPARKPTRVSRD